MFLDLSLKNEMVVLKDLTQSKNVVRTFGSGTHALPVAFYHLKIQDLQPLQPIEKMAIVSSPTTSRMNNLGKMHETT